MVLLTMTLPLTQHSSAAIYLHIPFCKQACHYCNFHFSTKLQYQPLVIASMCKELYLRRDYLSNRSITTIYFGGGTPSLLPIQAIEKIFHQILHYFPIAPDVEVTLEANPDDITLEKLKALRHMGVNRLSIGVQSFNDMVLHYMHRAHTSDMAKKSIIAAEAAGFDNLNIDLIYAIPGITVVDWHSDLNQALALDPAHISAYCLTIEPKTVFGHWYQQGKLIEVNQEVTIEQFELTVNHCLKHGYIHYEIANFCKPNRFSRHNVNYWTNGSYLGIGPGAHSYNGCQRQANVSNNVRYIKAIQNNALPYTEEALTMENHINEYIMTTIRTCWGCDLDWITKQYGVNLKIIHKHYIADIIALELAYLVGNTLCLTNKGKLLASKIAEDLFIERAFALKC